MAVLQEIKVPLLAVNDTTLTVVEILFENGASIKSGDILMVFETSKTTYDVVAEADGYVNYLCEAGNDYDVNHLVATVVSDKAEIKTFTTTKVVESDKTLEPLKPSGVQTFNWQGETIFSNAAATLMAQHQVGKDKFAGYDLVSTVDVEKLLGIYQPAQETVTVNKSTAAPKAIIPVVDETKAKLQKLSSNKKREIEFLSAVQSAGLTSTINTTIETDGIFGYINPSLKYFKNALLPIIIYETGRLLKQFPLLNAYFAGNNIALYHQVNIGFAIDIDKGLKVLKIADADAKTLQEVEENIMELSNQYLDDALPVEVLTDITFTITDLSGQAVSFFKPLVNSMNSGILGVSAIDEKLQRCVLSLTFDHRVTEGKHVAEFLQVLKERLESYQSKHHPQIHQNTECFKCSKTLSSDLSDVGFIKCITPKGQEAYICQSCFAGF